MTDDKLPEPFVPADVDLTDYKFMPLHYRRLFASETWNLQTAEEQVASLRLWCAAFGEETPAGSLPNNDRLLASKAGYGVAVKEFLKVKEAVMRGWILCSDGRLYHDFLAKVVMESWAGKRKHDAEKAADRDRKKAKRDAAAAGSPPDNPSPSAGRPPDTSPPSGGTPPENPLKGEGEGKGFDDGGDARARARAVADQIMDIVKPANPIPWYGMATNLVPVWLDRYDPERDILPAVRLAMEQRSQKGEGAPNGPNYFNTVIANFHARRIADENAARNPNVQPISARPGRIDPAEQERSDRAAIVKGMRGALHPRGEDPGSGGEAGGPGDAGDRGDAGPGDTGTDGD